MYKVLFDVVTDPHTTSVTVNQDFLCVHNWAQQWKMCFNPDPDKQAVELLFSQKNTIVPHPPLYFNNLHVHKQERHKHLGLLLDAKLSFVEHINEKVNKAYRIIGTLRFLSKYLPLHSLDQIYETMIRFHPDYCDMIYHIPHDHTFPFTLNSLMEKLERVQYNAALAITGTWHGTNRSKLYEELGWETLNDRRWSRRLIQFYKIHNNLTPGYQNIPPVRSSLYGVRYPHIYRHVFCNSSHQNNFFPNTIKLWNNLGKEFQVY